MKTKKKKKLKKKTMNRLVKPKLIRTLSEHHWVFAEQKLIKEGLDRVWAGSSKTWSYFVTRTGDRIVRHSLLKRNFPTPT